MLWAVMVLLILSIFSSVSCIEEEQATESQNETHDINNELHDNFNDILNSQTIVANHSNYCKQYNGLKGICRSSRTCVKQQPNQKLWNSCDWKNGERMPNRLCCYSDDQILEKLLKETDRKDDNHDYDDYDYDDEDYDLPKCGVSKIVSRILPFRVKDRRSKDEMQVYDMLFPAAYRIVMGNNVKVGQIPWMCSIYYRDQFVCGGSIIDHRHIITAAHCFESGSNPRNYYIRVGSVMLHNGTMFMVDRIFIHEKYIPPRIYHDIAIVRCKQCLEFTDYVSPVCLPKMKWSDKKRLIGKKALVSGFGDTTFGGSHAFTLKETDLKILNNSFCETNYNNLAESKSKFPVGMKNSIICAGHEQGGKDACQGDSGGPLTTHIDCVGHIIGIVSFGYKCALAHFPGIYTSVAYYLRWIRQKISSP